MCNGKVRIYKRAIQIEMEWYKIITILLFFFCSFSCLYQKTKINWASNWNRLIFRWKISFISKWLHFCRSQIFNWHDIRSVYWKSNYLSCHEIVTLSTIQSFLFLSILNVHSSFKKYLNWLEYHSTKDHVLKLHVYQHSPQSISYMGNGYPFPISLQCHQVDSDCFVSGVLIERYFVISWHYMSLTVTKHWN